jgi:RNA polymerase sigma-70 factor (ECF subfamily)
MNSVTRGGGLERFRSYLWLLVESQSELRRQGKLDPSGMVPQTLLQAPRAEAGLHGKSDQEKAAWLRQIRARNLANALRDLSREKRRREEPVSESSVARSDRFAQALTAARRALSPRSASVHRSPSCGARCLR